MKCYYYWNNIRKKRFYNPMVELKYITIFTHMSVLENKIQINQNNLIRTKEYIPTFKFNFDIDIQENYDCIIQTD